MRLLNKFGRDGARDLKAVLARHLYLLMYWQFSVLKKAAAGLELFCGIDRGLSHRPGWGKRSFEFVERGSSISDFGISWTGAVSWLFTKEISEHAFYGSG